MVNILHCNVTTWSVHARHYILTFDFDATLISETHLRRDGLLSAVTEAKKSGWTGTGSAATNTVNHGTSAGVLTLVRKRWFSKPLSICSDDTGILCQNPRLAGRVIRVMGREILLLAAYFEHSVGFRSNINANLIHVVSKSVARSVCAWRRHMDQATGCIGAFGRRGGLLPIRKCCWYSGRVR